MGEIICTTAFFCARNLGGSGRVWAAGRQWSGSGLGFGVWVAGKGGRLGVGEALVPRWELASSPSLSQPRRGSIYCKSRKLLITKLAGKGAGTDAVPHWHSTCLAAAFPASPRSALSSSSSPSFSPLSLSLSSSFFHFGFYSNVGQG